MSEITIPTADGGSFTAYAAQPAVTPAPGLVVIQEIFGVNKVMRDLTEGFAALGYYAVCPDLFWRQEPNVDITDQTQPEWEHAFALLGGFDVDLGIADLTATLNTVRSDPACTGTAGTIGYCLGGKLAYLMGARSDAACNVSYYGVDLVSFVDEAANVDHPLLLHVAADDQFVPKDAQAKTAAALADNPNATLHTYPGMDHAFARVGGKHYDSTAATLANTRTTAFLAAHLFPSDP